ncbi:GDSL family lipase [Marivivens niveibacter]|uniref:GDSL family lipase n=1 Tax=Marivivens niveibacter TaxID=1930667 RepID=A0A251WWJ5_9RHOB|nr:SGNH/GDSL hydrolase family protein [Marivivens niveibacter]OUD08860.1 GDSL family lipase [Marivivens niveibacter]
MLRCFFIVLVSILTMSCTDTVEDPSEPQILLLGDSMMAFNRLTGNSVADKLQDRLGTTVVDRSVSGARLIYNLPVSGAAGMKIQSQYVAGNWEWVVMNGGGNDILFGCGCGACDRRLDRLISADGQTGVIPDTIRDLRETGARVLYTGYLRTPGINGPIESCGPIGDEMDARIAKFAETDDGVVFVSLADLVPFGDRSFHGFDLIHPSIKGSDAISALIAEAIRNERQ